MNDECCWNCEHRLGEECDMFGHEVYPEDEPCDSYYPEGE